MASVLPSLALRLSAALVSLLILGSSSSATFSIGQRQGWASPAYHVPKMSPSTRL
jgi:hypothetical protein